MFIGHYALALAAKRAAPRTSLGTLFLAVQLADMLWPVLLILGWEHAHFVPGPNPFLTLWLDSIPVSHSLVALIAWGLLFGYLYRKRSGYARGAVVVGLLVYLLLSRAGPLGAFGILFTPSAMVLEDTSSRMSSRTALILTMYQRMRGSSSCAAFARLKRSSPVERNSARSSSSPASG